MNNVAGLAWEMKERAGSNSKNRADARMVEWLSARQTVWRNSTG
jgi:hypothetical protein